MSEDRWWFATVWLWLCLAANALSSLGIVYLMSKNPVMVSRLPILRIYFIVGPLAQVACIIALFRWRRWGWYGLLGIGVITVAANFARGNSILVCLSGLAGVAVTYAVLHGGGERKMWPRLV